MKQKKYLFLIVSVMFVMMMSLTASADWKPLSSGGYAWVNANGATHSSIYVTAEKAGLVKIAGVWYGYNLDNTPHKGFIRSPKYTWFCNANGLVIRNLWFRSGGHLYRATDNGTVPKYGLKKVGAYWYGFSAEGYVTYGIQTYNGNDYYFDPAANGHMVLNKLLKIGDYYYHFAKNGVMSKGEAIGQFYFYGDGRMAQYAWVGNRYYGGNGRYYTGLRTARGKLYYFDPTTGLKVTNTTKVVDGFTYRLDANGVATKIDTGEIRLPNGVIVEGSYKTDPEVTDEQLLSAIIYAESGNQPLYGQIAVGMVIMNRVKNYQFPTTLKEVIYQDQQFEPTRNGALTRYLKDPSLVSEESKKAAATTLARVAKGNYKVYIKTKWYDLKDYFFFMTPAAYARLRLTSTPLYINSAGTARVSYGHVFFKYWK